jgi:hypothetical protein
VITPEQEATILGMLRGQPPGQAVISVALSGPPTPGGRCPGETLANLLRSARWSVRREEPRRRLPTRGVCVVVKDTARPPSGAALLLGSLRVAGVEARGEADPTLDSGTAEEFWVAIEA